MEKDNYGVLILFRIEDMDLFIERTREKNGFFSRMPFNRLNFISMMLVSDDTASLGKIPKFNSMISRTRSQNFPKK